MKTVELAIRQGEQEREYIGAAVVGGVRKAEHVLILGAYGELRTKGGNPNRCMTIADPIWWLDLIPGIGKENEIIVRAELVEKS